MKNVQFHGKVALITGAGGGIGRAIAIRMQKMGYTLALLGRNEEKLRQTAEMAGCVESTLFVVGDLTDADFVQSVIATVVEKLGRLDVLVNNAGLCYIQNMEEMPYDIFDRVMKTNVYAPYMLCRDAIKPLRQSDCATIINIGSVVSHEGYPAQSAYGASKHALMGMTKALATEVYKDGIRVHILCPGGVNTDMVRIARPDLDTSVMIESEDIADIVEFLLAHRTNAVIDQVRIHRSGKAPF